MPNDPLVTRHLRQRWAELAGATIAAAAAATIVVASRADPLLSPDSITYLAAAEHLRSGAGLTDLTGEPLTVFGPVVPLLLTPGGAGLGWAVVVEAVSVALAVLAMFVIVRRRAGPVAALCGAAALGFSSGLIRVGATVWSEAPYIAVSLLTVAVLGRKRLTTRQVAVGGLLSGIGFLTRYAGAGLIASAAAMVLVGCLAHVRRWRTMAIFVACAIGPVAAWVIRNLIVAGQPLGPRFEGGATEPWSTLIRLPVQAMGELLGGPGRSSTARAQIGWAVVVLAVAALGALSVHFVRRFAPWREAAGAVPADHAFRVDVGMTVFAITGILVPVAARRLTSNDIEYRVMSPMLIPAVYAATVAGAAAVRRVRPQRARIAVAALAVLGVGWWSADGLDTARRMPELAGGSAGNRNQFSAQLHDRIDRLPADATVITNSPQRVWWFNRREPTLFGFTQPRPGNSHYPLELQDTLDVVCDGNAYLAWFTGLRNAGNSPFERRPDLTAVIILTPVEQYQGGQLFALSVAAERCPDSG